MPSGCEALPRRRWPCPIPVLTGSHFDEWSDLLNDIGRKFFSILEVVFEKEGSPAVLLPWTKVYLSFHNDFDKWIYEICKSEIDNNEHTNARMVKILSQTRELDIVVLNNIGFLVAEIRQFKIWEKKEKKAVVAHHKGMADESYGGVCAEDYMPLNGSAEMDLSVVGKAPNIGFDKGSKIQEYATSLRSFSSHGTDKISENASMEVDFDRIEQGHDIEDISVSTTNISAVRLVDDNNMALDGPFDRVGETSNAYANVDDLQTTVLDAASNVIEVVIPYRNCFLEDFNGDLDSVNDPGFDAYCRSVGQLLKLQQIKWASTAKVPYFALQFYGSSKIYQREKYRKTQTTLAIELKGSA